MYVIGVGDFDVHAGEAQRQPALLADLDAALAELFTTSATRRVGSWP